MKKNNLLNLAFGILIALGLSSCATIIGGSRYNAYISVPDGKKAAIYLNNQYLGTGNAFTQIRRRDANKLVFRVKEEGCPDQQFIFRARTFRGWAFFFSLVGWTGVIQGVPVPWGIFVDAAAGAYWKPNLIEPGIQKITYKNYRYTLNYSSCNNSSDPSGVDKIVLKTGAMYEGKIVEEEPNKSIKIKDSSGREFYFKIEEIEKIVRRSN